MGVDRLAEHDDVEVGVANAEHVVWRVADDVDLSRDEGRSVGRTRRALDELAADPAGFEQTAIDGDRRGEAGEGRGLADAQRVDLGCTDLGRGGFVCWLIGRFVCGFVRWLIRRFVVCWLIRRFVGGFIGGFVRRGAGPFVSGLGGAVAVARVAVAATGCGQHHERQKNCKQLQKS